MANPHPIPLLYPQEPYQPRNPMKLGAQGAIAGGVAGLFTAAVQNSLAKTNVGAWGVLTRSGGTIGLFTAVPMVLGFTRDATANLREKDDAFNGTVGAFVAGSLLGLKSGRMPQILGWGAVAAVVQTAYEFTGSSLKGKKVESEFADEFERKEHLRKNRRRPIEETVAELGEGRGIKPPGYEERRRERLKEKYGVEINPVSATADE
ncbi:hypothetical protein BX600DRAFT_510790 [Xylariales sp. PMI_506]|nr:hypothetical protein BX600DRAFT_510790 [Xylariales sp. PMI_506]